MSSANGKSGPDAAGGPTFLDNVCVHLASSLLGPTTVTDHLTTSMMGAHAAACTTSSTQQLYWRSPILSPLSVLQSSTSPVVSQEAQSRVVYVDLTVSFLPPPQPSNTSTAAAADPAETKRPRVRAKFGALLRHWHPIRLDAGTGVIDRTCRPNGGTYIQQGRYLSKRGLREYGDSISIDLDSMESRPTARLLGKALGGTGLRAEVANSNGDDCSGGSPRVIVTIDHHSLGETGSFAIVDGKEEDDGGWIGEKAMAMLLANIEAKCRRKSTTAATCSTGNSPPPGAKSPSVFISGVDPEEENGMRRAFEQWWDTTRRGASISKETSSASDPSAPIGKTNQSPPVMAVKGATGIAKLPHDTTNKSSVIDIGIGIGIDKESVGMPANMERKPPTSITANEQLTKSNDSALVGANGVKENVTNGSSKGVTSTSGAAAKGGDNPSTAAASAEAADAAEAKASSSPSQVQKKKRKAPGPILVRAGGGVGGGRKKKKRGKFTIGKAS
mmetsp:Transcript_31801/g.93386  ORF Transcript_31801/g.93386 Transcript_31801/m.93386 type:complete len:501 (-) Transcript_31801:1576-3078(-)